MVVLITACGSDPADSDAEVGGPAATVFDPLPDAGQPSWVVSVYPSPSAAAAPERTVAVDHDLLPPNHNVRLIIDGVDVTGQAALAPGARLPDGASLTQPQRREPRRSAGEV